MQKGIYFNSHQNQVLLCSYFPVYTYFPPYTYTQPSVFTLLNSNFGNVERKQETITTQNIPSEEVRQTAKPSKNQAPGRIKKNKRRNHRNKSKLIQSAKKNCQSNIINHVLTFLMRNKHCQTVVERGIKRLNKPPNTKEGIKQLFFNFLKLIDLKRQRKYINRKTVLCYFTPQSLLKELPCISQNLGSDSLVTIAQLCYLYRICVFYYLKNLSPIAILTSKRIETIAKKIHLKRRTFIIKDLQEQRNGDEACLSDQ